MEPTFIATPYAQASSPQSRQIRAWLDEREASYEQWRAARKPVKHAFASAKLNSPVRLQPAQRKAVADTRTSVPLWEALSNQTATAQAAATTQKRVDPTSERRNSTLPLTSIGAGAATQPAISASRKSSLQRSSLSTLLLPSIVHQGRTSQQRADNSRAGSRSAVQQAALEHLPAMTSATAIRVKTPARVRTSALAKKRLQAHLYDFHSCHVFSFAPSPDDDEPTLSALDSVEQPECADDVALDYECNNAPLLDDTDAQSAQRSSASASTDTSALTADPLHTSCILDGVAFTTAQDYARMFEHDWHASDVDRIVRDAVERQRIHTILKSAYRELLWYFRFYAGKVALVSGASRDLFQVPSRLHLLEDLSVPCMDAPRFGITDSPLRCDALINFLLSVAKMLSAHSVNPARQRVLVAEGIELSDAVQTLMRDHFRVYAQLQDVDHFRCVFLRWSHTRRIANVLSKHRVDLQHFFCESIGTAAGDASDRSSSTMSATQFLSALRALRLITNPKAPIASAVAGTDSGATMNAPNAIDEGRALRAFLACLELCESDCSGSGATSPQATLEQFIEALLRVALLRRELVVCRGSYDVCPGELTSERCMCSPESAHYDFAAFDDAADELFAAIHTFRLQQTHKRTAAKMHALNSLQLSAVQSSPLRTQHRLAPTIALSASSSDDDNK